MLQTIYIYNSVSVCGAFQGGFVWGLRTFWMTGWNERKATMTAIDDRGIKERSVKHFISLCPFYNQVATFNLRGA